MSHLKFAPQKTAAAILAVAGMTLPEHSAEAGPLCDWLFGRHTVAYAPYAAAYPVAAAAPYAAAYPTAVAAPYAAAYPTAVAPTAVAPSSYAAAYPASVAPTNYGANYGAAVGSGATGAAALQMPAYSAAYPGSVAGAIPAQGANDQGYGMFSPPAGSTFPVAPVPQTSFYGTGNVYPSTTAAVAPVAPVTAYQPAVDTTPSTIQTYPGIPAARPGLLGGLARFFGSAFGHGYNSSYYRAPVTYYRPVTTVDPSTGAAVVVQQPCTSYQQQLQRSPVTTLAPAAPVAAPVAAAPCAPSAAAPAYNPYGSPSPNAGSVAPATGYSGGTNAPADYYAPPLDPNAAPSTAPAPYPGAGVSPGYDRSTVPQPQLDPSGRPVTETSTRSPAAGSTPVPSSTWWPRSVDRAASTDGPRITEPRTDIRPLPAPEYPYPRGETGTTEQPAIERNREPSGTDGRVARADYWGYKPIHWQTDSATDVQPAGNYEPTTPSPHRAAAPPVILSPRQSEPRPSSPAVPEPARVYDNSGWSSTPRR